MSSLNVKPEFAYVLGAAGASFFVFGVEYPALYADEKSCPNETNRKTFNCVQRAHQNSLENQPIFLSLLTLSGLQYPVTAAALGGLYLVGRVGYVEGYSTGEPSKRINYVTALQYVGLLGLVGTTIKFAVDLLSK